MTDPNRIVANSRWSRRSGADPAAYLVNPGSIPSPDKPSAGGLAHPRPYLVAGNSIFVFPVGVEGFTRSGQATLGTHKYIGDNAIDGVTTHYEEARITLVGTFPGLTAQQTMVDCVNILRALHPENGITLYAAGVFDKEQYVLPETWEFTHDKDDRTHSIDYTITFVRIGEGGTVRDAHGQTPADNISGNTKGKPNRIFTAKDGVQTLRAVAAVVYGDSTKWTQIVSLNAGQFASWQKENGPNAIYELPSYQIPTYRWPNGTQFRY